MREPEGIETPLPGRSSERAWSKGREPDIRNVEAEGSSPFTSTKGPGQRAEGGIPQKIRFSGVSLRALSTWVWFSGNGEIRNDVHGICREST